MSEEDSYNKKNSENNDDDFDDIDEDRPSLMQIKNKFIKEEKKENNQLMLKKRQRNNDNTDIIYDAKKKKILNCFCPNLEELNNFLKNCEIIEIKDDYTIQKLKEKEENIFDPIQFMENNFQKSEYKSYLNMEDITLAVHKKKLEYPKELNNKEESYIPKPKIEYKKDLIEDILKNEILEENQKKELNKLISEIKKMDIKNIIKKDKLEKLNIVFDLDNTCIFGFTVIIDTYLKLNEKFPKKNLKLISFLYDKKEILSCIIIRKGLSEFLEFSKLFCNFYISTLGVESYGIKIMDILENINKIKFHRFKGRKDNEEDRKKILKDLDLDIKNTIIFDDKPSIWVKDYLNVILSKIFTDKEFEKYIPKRTKYDDEKLNFLFNYFPFYYYKSKTNDYNQINWRKQKLLGGRTSPFYKFNNKDDTINNDCYSGEYLDSKKCQFDYMKDIIKIVYYLVFNYDIQVPDALKLIRYNIFYNTYFSLKFYQGEGKNILKDIIENCGGKIIQKNINNEKIFYICRKEDFTSLKYNIKKEIYFNEKSKIVTERYILDSFYFMTNLEKELDEPEYSFIIQNNDEDYNY